MQFELTDVEKVYRMSEENKVYGARGINLTILESDFMALVGPSGSGKTTVLNLIAGLILPTGGRLCHAGKDITSFSLEERTEHRLQYMGFIFQDYQLLPVLTAYENVEFPLQLKNFPKKEIRDRVEWALAQVGLTGMGDRFPKQLSGGQQQRVSIARAIVSRPQPILADEPTANLDSRTAQEIIDLFKKLNQDFKLTFVFSTHDQRLIDQVKTVLYIKDGQIIETKNTDGENMKINFRPKELFFCAAIGVNANNADEWWKYSDDQMRGDRSRAELVMTIKTPNWTRTLEIESDVNGKKEALSTIKSPAKEKGIRTLRIENNMWYYFPKLKRKVAVSSSMLLASWMGSDFTNDDILKASSMSSDYTHAFLPDETVDGESMKVINNLAKPSSKVMWPKIVTLSSKKDCLPRVSRYYDKENNLKRVLTFSDVKEFDGHKMPTIWKMQPLDDKSKETTLIYREVDFDVKFPGDHFSQKTLTQ